MRTEWWRCSPDQPCSHAQPMGILRQCVSQEPKGMYVVVVVVYVVVTFITKQTLRETRQNAPNAQVVVDAARRKFHFIPPRGCRPVLVCNRCSAAWTYIYVPAGNAVRSRLAGASTDRQRWLTTRGLRPCAMNYARSTCTKRPKLSAPGWGSTRSNMAAQGPPQTRSRLSWSRRRNRRRLAPSHQTPRH